MSAIYESNVETGHFSEVILIHGSKSNTSSTSPSVSHRGTSEPVYCSTGDCFPPTSSVGFPPSFSFPLDAHRAAEALRRDTQSAVWRFASVIDSVHARGIVNMACRDVRIKYK